MCRKSAGVIRSCHLPVRQMISPAHSILPLLPSFLLSTFPRPRCCLFLVPFCCSLYHRLVCNTFCPLSLPSLLTTPSYEIFLRPVRFDSSRPRPGAGCHSFLSILPSFSLSRKHTMAALLLKVSLFAASATQVLASCAYGTHIQPRAEEGGAVKVNTFGYAGTIVSELREKRKRRRLTKAAYLHCW
jgi:hypothetical protein